MQLYLVVGACFFFLRRQAPRGYRTMTCTLLLKQQTLFAVESKIMQWKMIHIIVLMMNSKMGVIPLDKQQMIWLWKGNEEKGMKLKKFHVHNFFTFFNKIYFMVWKKNLPVLSLNAFYPSNELIVSKIFDPIWIMNLLISLKLNPLV